MGTSPAVLLVLGEQHTNDTLAGELTRDGYRARRVSDPAVLRARSTPSDVELIIVGATARQRAASLAVLRALRAAARPTNAARYARAVARSKRRAGRDAARLRRRR